MYGQDEWQAADHLKFTFGLRASLITFGNTALENTIVSGLDFVDGEGLAGYKINTGKMPDAKVVLEPRFGFNYDAFKNKKTQVRGGTGLFTGRPPYVFLSNQIGNSGVLNNFINQTNTKAYPFSPDPTTYIPDNPQAATTSLDIASTDNEFKYPQVWKSNLAIDQKIGNLLIASAEFLFNQNINAVNYFNANLAVPTTTFAGPDNRQRYTTNRVNSNISNAIVLNNADKGYYRAATFKLEMPRRRGFYAMAAYTASETTDLMSAGSIAATSWTGARSVNGNNNVDLAFSDNHTPHRLIGLLNYRINYGKKIGGATEISLGYVGSRSSANSYTYAGDMNGDGVNNNDLIFVPLKGSDLAWQTLTIVNAPGDTVRYDAAAQAAAYDAFIDQDDYLKTRRGQYAERNAVIFPWLNQLDLGIMQEVGIMTGSKRNALQIRLDILNFGNLLNSDWGVGNVLNQSTPLSYRATTAAGVPEFRINTQSIDGKNVPLRDTWRSRNTLDDVWQAQVSIRYLFNQ